MDVFDFGGLYGAGADVQIFNSPSTAANIDWLTWTKPKGKSTALMILIGGGAGGGGGFSGIAGSARGGGGGGQGSAITKAYVPLCLLPDTLYIQVGAGTPGVSTGTAGIALVSYICIAPNNTPLNTIAASSSAGAGGGVTGTGAAVGTGGNNSTAATFANMPLCGIFSAYAGLAGNNGGAVAGANGTGSIISVQGNNVLGGTGGAGTTNADFQGGAYTAVAGSVISDYRPLPGAAGSSALVSAISR